MSKQATVEGLAKMRRDTEALAAALGVNLAKATIKGGRLVQTNVIKAIKAQSPGEAVTRYHPGQAPVDHVASKPGDAPNTDTGELIRGIQVEIAGRSVLVGVEASQDEKANALEFGTLDGTLAARPFLFPAFEAAKPQIAELMAQAVREDLK